MTTGFASTWVLIASAALAIAAEAKTFRIRGSVLLFGNYNEVSIVTAQEERLVRPPVDVVLLDVASGRTITMAKNGLPVFGWISRQP